MKAWKVLALLAVLLGSTLAAETVKLRVIETTDLHTNIMDYNYYRDKADDRLGLVRAASLIREARAEVANSILVDNGDLIQGSPMGDYVAAKGLVAGEVHPVHQAMNALGYDAANIGNHEFNYGLDYLKSALSGASFPYVNSNVLDAKTGHNVFTPFVIKPYEFKDSAGKKHRIKVGYIGFVPPEILVWDKKNLEGKVKVLDITKAAERFVPEMKAQGADVVIAIPHSGLSTAPYKEGMANSVYYLSQVKGIDAIAFGHSHAVFPGDAYYNSMDGVDGERGTVNGIPATMPGRWGSHIGVIDLTLDYSDGDWKVVDGVADTREIYNKRDRKSLAAPDEKLREVLKDAHEKTRGFVNAPIGAADSPMYSYLALVQDDPTIQIVNLAQKDYVERYAAGVPELAGLPIISAAAPFKTGGRKNDPTNYTEVEAGQMTFRNASDLYLYPNTLVVLKLTGKEIRQWLECSAGMFNQIDPASSEEQALLNWDGFRSYNFDVIDGLTYEVDVTKAPRYNGSCKMLNEDSHRVLNLRFEGKEVQDEQVFLLATNNYRGFGGKFPGTGGDYVVYASPDENRTIVADYIKRVSAEKGMVTPKADFNWKFKLIDTPKLKVYFETAPGAKAEQFIKENSLYPLKLSGTDENGFARYYIDLSRER